MEPNSIKYVLEDSIESFSNFESYNDDQDNISNISISDMLKIFNPIEDETDEIIPAPMPTRSNLFKVGNTTKVPTVIKKRKRGRQTNLKEGNKKHDKFPSDNL